MEEGQKSKFMDGGGRCESLACRRVNLCHSFIMVLCRRRREGMFWAGHKAIERSRDKGDQQGASGGRGAEKSHHWRKLR